ncbi:ABC transporter permease [Rhizobium rosettiformans]|uniref:ABC transporter permease n=1 Tax=Rhizobium rosettiformans TaxID=1368430 RepID=UPI0028602FCD|nr:ABC transporter permease [Rhizobium rosettiformans]MDR7031168.1 ribose/xylose/arabinose/galactoside ABC-type transport system permease subunit [Rhizobium rosettiformans]MDR7066733.1 ribose/xylose/arabinose/galactoside ABC-type transport system permease subunit [Rhizobium rosettiformans]
MQATSQAAASNLPVHSKAQRVGFLVRGGHQLIIIALIVILGLAIYTVQPRFLSAYSIDNILRMASIYGIVALGMTLVIISGGIDLSAGSMMALGAAFGAGLLGTAFGAVNPISLPPVLAILVALAVTGGIGMLNGMAVAKLGIPPFVVTLGMMTVVRGITFIFADFTVGSVPGSAITFMDPLFSWLGAGSFGPVPTTAVLFLLLAFLLAMTLRYTPFGRAIYAIGGDAAIARLAGINIPAVIVGVYGLMGVLAALSGIVQAGRLSSVSPLMAMGYELDIITIVIVGGASLAGGRGTILGTVLAAVLVSMIDNGLTMMNVPSFYQYLVKGSVLLAAVILDQWYQRCRAA